MSGFADRADTGYPASYRVYDYAPQRIRARTESAVLNGFKSEDDCFEPAREVL
jgi:hypothetical protein